MDNLRLMSLVRGGTELVLPVTPSAYAVSAGMRIETLNIHGLGDINVAGYPTLAAIGIDGFLPANDYQFAHRPTQNPYTIIDIIKGWISGREVVRYIVQGTPINIPVLIEDISYGERDGTNDIYYTLKAVEYRYTEVEEVSAGWTIPARQYTNAPKDTKPRRTHNPRSTTTPPPSRPPVRWIDMIY